MSKYTKLTKFGLEVLAGKVLSVRLEFIVTGKKVFFYKYKLSIALLYLADTFINNLQTSLKHFTEWF